jgi:D-sedoheptulose 7-phosphate isomerase
MNEIETLLVRYPQLAPCRPEILAAAERMAALYEGDGLLLVCGNGGSCADAEHIVGELMKGFCRKRPLTPAQQAALRAQGPWGAELAQKLQRPLRALSLCGAPALATAFANDVDPALAFAQQAYALGEPGGVLLGISTSGNARNVLAAALAAKAKGSCAIGLTGAGGGAMAGVFDILIRVPETETYRVQELHLPVYHALCLATEARFFEE